MTISFTCRQAVTLVRVLIEHVGSDPVFFGVQLSRRLPRTVSAAVGKRLARVPVPVCRIAGRWLAGDASGAEKALRQQLEADDSNGVVARISGEYALSMRMGNEAARFAERIQSPKSGRSLRARIAWQTGDMNNAIAIAERGRLHSRLASERAIFEPGWTPALPARLPRIEVPDADVLHMLTNSLPHTQSGYTLRSHAVLRSLQAHSFNVLSGTRTGYPVSVGRFSYQDRDSVDGVTYVRDVPWNQGRTAEERLQKQAGFTAALAVGSNAQVLHTTTHFVNGVAVRAAAKRLDLPWVYEVRGVLEETWAASAGSPAERQKARDSERFRLFRARETEIALEADRVVTLGMSMASELMNRGIPEDRILVAPNAVSHDLLRYDISRAPGTVREENGLPSDGTWVGTAASIVGYEGLDVLIDSVAEARRAGSDIRLLIVGDGTELPSLIQRAEPLGEAAVFAGRLPQKRAHELITALDIFAVPRRDDPVCSLVTPLKPVEAAGLARPVMLSDLPALTEALPTGARSAIQAGAVHEWAEELSRLEASEDERVEMGQVGRNYVECHRTWEAIGNRYAEMYAELGVGGLT